MSACAEYQHRRDAKSDAEAAGGRALDPGVPGRSSCPAGSPHGHRAVCKPQRAPERPAGAFPGMWGARGWGAAKVTAVASSSIVEQKQSIVSCMSAVCQEHCGLSGRSSCPAGCPSSHGDAYRSQRPSTYYSWRPPIAPGEPGAKVVADVS